MKKLRAIIVLITLSFIFFLFPLNSNNILAGAQEDEKVVFNIGFGGYFALDDLDPTLATGTETWWIYSNVVDPLFRWDWDKEEYYGVLATGFEIENLTTMLIHLRENVTFHDGTPFNAQAVKWNWEREKLIAKPLDHVSHSSWYFISDQLRPYETDDWNLDHIPPGEDYPQLRKIEVVNDTCVRIISNTGRPIPPTGGFQWWAIVSPTYYAGNETASWLGHDSLIGTGPFKYVGYDQIEGLIKLEANENYWNVTPAIDEINIIQFATAEVAQTALLTGELDYMSGPPDPVSINESEVVNLIDPQGPLGYWGATYWIVMPLHAINVTMRKAIAYAWDYDLAIETDQNGYALPAGGVFPFNNKYYNESIPKPYHNIDIARQTLIDAGIAPSEAANWTDEQWKNRAETDPLALFPFTYPASANAIYQVLVASAKTIGVEIIETLLTDSQYNSNFAGPRQDRYDNLAAAYTMVLMDDGPDTARGDNWAFFHSSQYWNFANTNDAELDNWTVYWFVTNATSEPYTTQDVCNMFTDKIQNEIFPHIWVYQAKKHAAMSIDFEGDTGNALQRFQYVKPKEPEGGVTDPLIPGLNIEVIAIVSIVVIIGKIGIVKRKKSE